MAGNFAVYVVLERPPYHVKYIAKHLFTVTSEYIKIGAYHNV